MGDVYIVEAVRSLQQSLVKKPVSRAIFDS